MNGLTLHPMNPSVVTEAPGLHDQVVRYGPCAGHTIIGKLSDEGHHGLQEAHLIFSEQEASPS